MVSFESIRWAQAWAKSFTTGLSFYRLAVRISYARSHDRNWQLGEVFVRGRFNAKARSVYVGGAALVLLGMAGIVALRPSADDPLIGMVRTTEIKVQTEISGRIVSIRVHPGDHVTTNSVVA